MLDDAFVHRGLLVLVLVWERARVVVRGTGGPVLIDEVVVVLVVEVLVVLIVVFVVVIISAAVGELAAEAGQAKTGQVESGRRTAKTTAAERAELALLQVDGR